MKEINVSYYELLMIRTRFDAVLLAEKTKDKIILSCCPNTYVTFICELIVQNDTASEYIHYKNNIEQFCNAPVDARVIEYNTHNFATSSSWLYGSNNSLFIIQPKASKKIQILNLSAKVGKNIDVGVGQEFKVIIWQSLSKTNYQSSPCKPYVAGVKTDYSTFTCIEQDPYQEYKIYIDVETNSLVTEFTFSSLREMLLKAKDSLRLPVQGEIYDQLCCEWDYQNTGIYVPLYACDNERLELYIANNVPYTSTDFAQIICRYKSLTDW